MNRIKLLFITRDFTTYLERNTHYLSQELAKATELILWHDPGHIQDILHALPDKPDFILLNDLRESRCPPIEGLDSVKIPLGIIMHDIHDRVEERKKFIEVNQVKHLFTIYRDPFKRWFPEYIPRMHWLPHFIQPDIFKDYGLPKEIDWLMMGRIAFYYPLRMQIYETMKDEKGFVYHQHPGYRQIGEDEDEYVGEKYAREINRAKMFLTCSSNLHYPLIKYYEVLACRTLLLAPSLRELEDLGFVPNVHFVPIDKNDFLEKARYYLQHESERQAIANEGCRLVHSRHTVKVRTKQLVEMITDILHNES